MVGSALVRRLQTVNCTLLTVSHRDLDLTRQREVEAWVAEQRPQAVFLAAAKVGGIVANDSAPVDFLYDNLAIATNVMHAAATAGVEKLLFLGSSCIYPKFAPQPIKEEALLTGPLEPTNQWYAVAKIAGLKLCQAYRRQQGCDFISAMPTNLYGPRDNFDLTTSHVIPALIRKAHEAKTRNDAQFVIWGSGNPRREFLHVDDAADALVHLMTNYSGESHVNVGCGTDLTILELASRIAGVVGFRGSIATDPSKPDGTPRKLLDVGKLSGLGWRPKIELEEGIASTYRWFLENVSSEKSNHPSTAQLTAGAPQLTEKVALITGITGQDGSLLARLLLDKGYVVHGIKRRSSSFNTGRVDDIYVDPHEEGARFFLHYGDMTDATNLIRLLQDIRPHEIYNLAAQSHVQVSFETPEYTANADALGTLRLLEAMRILRLENSKFYQASTSELYGKVRETPQRETTPFYPRSPYGVAKLYAYWITVNYREAYGLFAANGILFNHESPVRGETFVTRKITRAVAAIEHGLQDVLYIGNLDAKRDWGHAKDFVKGMWLILQQQKPDDFVLATGESYSVRQFIELAFAQVGRNVAWKGSGNEEVGFDRASGKELVKIDQRYFRPTEVDELLGDPSKAQRELGWKAETSFKDLVAEMVTSDLELIRSDPNAVARVNY